MSNPSSDQLESHRNYVVLSLVVASLFALLDFWGYGLTSLWRHRNQIRSTQRLIAIEQENVQATERTRKRLDAWRAKSISSSASQALGAYQRALLEIAQELDVEEVTVEPGPPKDFPGVGKRATCTIKAAMLPLQFAQLVDRVSQLDTLHRITRLDITGRKVAYRSPAGADAAPNAKPNTMRVALTAEIIAMADSFEASGPTAEPRLTELKTQESDHSFATALKQHPIFSRYTPPAKPAKVALPAPKPTPKVEQGRTKVVAIVAPPPPNQLERLKYVGSFSTQGRWQAWIYDTQSMEQYAVSENDVLRSGKHAMRIVTIESDYLEFELADDSSAAIERVDLGNKLL